MPSIFLPFCVSFGRRGYRTFGHMANGRLSRPFFLRGLCTITKNVPSSLTKKVIPLSVLTVCAGYYVYIGSPYKGYLSPFLRTEGRIARRTTDRGTETPFLNNQCVDSQGAACDNIVQPSSHVTMPIVSHQRMSAVNASQLDATPVTGSVLSAPEVSKGHKDTLERSPTTHEGKRNFDQSEAHPDVVYTVDQEDIATAPIHGSSTTTHSSLPNEKNIMEPVSTPRNISYNEPSQQPDYVCPASDTLLLVIKDLFSENKALLEQLSDNKTAKVQCVDDPMGKTQGDAEQNEMMYQALSVQQRKRLSNWNEKSKNNMLSVLSLVKNEYRRLENDVTTINENVEAVENHVMRLLTMMENLQNRTKRIQDLDVMREQWVKGNVSCNAVFNKLWEEYSSDTFVREVLQSLAEPHDDSLDKGVPVKQVCFIEDDFVYAYKDMLQCVFLSGDGGLVHHMFATTRRWMYERTGYVVGCGMPWETDSTSKELLCERIRYLTNAMRYACSGDVYTAYNELLRLDGLFPVLFKDWMKRIELRLEFICMFDAIKTYLQDKCKFE